MILRTPDDRFENLHGFEFAPHYVEINDCDLGALRIHYLDEGPDDGPVILCMHGNPSWSYLYRKMIPPLVTAGFRVLVPDLVGFGRSDKPARAEDYSYAKHISWMSDWLVAMNVSNVTLVAQDWGGLIGLRLATAMPDLFSAMSLSNTGLPTGDQPMQEAFLKWRAYCNGPVDFDAGLVVNEFGRGTLTNAEMDAYRAPFPEPGYLLHVKAFADLVPASPDNAESENNRSAWQQLMQWQKPVLLCFSNGDPVTAGGDKVLMKLVPGTAGQPHITLDGGHFIQETQGRQWAQAIVDWLKN